MEEFAVQESDKFKADMEEAVFWLYSHNLEQSQNFADKKSSQENSTYRTG